MTKGRLIAFLTTASLALGVSAPAFAEYLFHVATAPDRDTHKRAYAAALLAPTTRMTVAIYNYANNNCDGASYIELGPQ
jgi:hypothetical protein